ncbi:MAG TPA: response regulator [Chloroflexota bacterium]|nr:response regulator [Chloroflexota bacterium]
MARILVVDDSEPVREICGRMLSRLGHEVVTAADAAEALTVYGVARPDAVLLDVGLPDRSGLDVLVDLRDANPDVRVAMLTAERERAVVLRALELGVRDYLVKPFALERLREAMLRLFA